MSSSTRAKKAVTGGASTSDLKPPPIRGVDPSGQLLASFVKTAFGDWWNTRGYDKCLRSALWRALPMVKVDAFLVKIAGRSDMAYARPGKNRTGTLEQLKSVTQALLSSGELDELQGGEGRRKLNSTHRFAITCIPVNGEISNASTIAEEIPARGIEDLNYCAYAYKGTHAPQPGDYNESEGEHFARFYAETICLVLFDLFRNREHRLSAFSKEVSKRYWDDSHPKHDSARCLLIPPWERQKSGVTEGHLTATLSLDLRRSTYCMEQTDVGAQFGEWLEELVMILRAVTHHNGGVFDKFTGDGALVHFLERDCQEVYGTKAVSAAVVCAMEMQEAVGIHLRRLQRFLRFNSAKLGAGVAIDVSEAFWSIDSGDNPIVVGRGVVGACRSCGSAPAGAIRLTNIARQKLCADMKSTIGHLLHEVPLVTKEFGQEMGVQVWEFQAPTLPSHIERLCQAVYDRRVAYSIQS